MFSKFANSAKQLSKRGARMVHTEAHMKERGIVLPAYQGSVHNYVKGQRDGNLLYIGDHVGQDDNAVTVRGKVGEGEGLVSPEQAYDLARNAGLRLLSTLSAYCDGNLDKVDQVVKMTGIVNGEPDFKGHGKVINGCSDVLVEVLGEAGRHARTCTGSGSLPAAVTCEMVVRLKDEQQTANIASLPTAGKGKAPSPVDVFLKSPKAIEAPAVFSGLFQDNKCWHDVSGVTYGVITESFKPEDLFNFNKTHGTTYLNYIPDEPVQKHFAGITTGKTIVWGAFVENNGQSQMVGLISGDESAGYWMETKTEEVGTPFFINEFAVDPNQRGKGIGKMLTSLSVDTELGITKTLAKQGIKCNEMWTTFHQENGASRASFLKGGYKEVVTYKDSLRERNTTVAKWSNLPYFK